jgi:uncharacterized membrane protein
MLGEELKRRLAGVSRVYVLHRVGPLAVLMALVAGYATFYGLWSVRNYSAFQAPAFDIGIFSQGTWLLSRFKDPFVTIMGLNLFGDNVSFILLAFVPLYWVWPAQEALLVVQAMALAVGGIPVYLLGRTVLKNNWFALIPALAYLLYPALGWLNLENFHPDSLEVPLVLFAVLCALRGRWRWYWVLVFLLLMVKADVWLFVVPMGIYVAIRHNRKVGLITAGIAIAWFLVAFFLIQPALSGVSAGSLDSWRWPFGGFGGMIKTAVLRPWEVISYMLTAEKVKYLFQLLTPLLFLPLLTWRGLIAVPLLFFHLVSTFWYQSNLHYHYHALLTAVLTSAALLSLERFRRLKVRWALAVLVLVATVLSAYLWGPLPGSREPSYYPDRQDAVRLAANEALALIPADAIVSADQQFATHLANREMIYLFPNPYSVSYWGDDSLRGQRLPRAEEIEYVMVMPGSLGEDGVRVYGELPEEGFAPIFEKNGIVLLHREVDEPGTAYETK